MAWNTTPHTAYSKWLNINGINRYFTDFDPNYPARFTVKFNVSLRACFHPSSCRWPCC